MIESTNSADAAGSTDRRDRERERAEADKTPLKLSYTINLNLPATTEIEVSNAIFKSLRENLLRQL